MKTKKNNEENANIPTEIENSASEKDSKNDQEEAQLQRLAASIRKILSARKARRHIAPEIPAPDDESNDDPASEDRQVEWMMRLML